MYVALEKFTLGACNEIYFFIKTKNSFVVMMNIYSQKELISDHLYDSALESKTAIST